MLVATWLLTSAALVGFGLLFVGLFPRISLLECIGGAGPLGLTLSAWLALLLKSLVFERWAVAAMAVQTCRGLLRAHTRECSAVPAQLSLPKSLLYCYVLYAVAYDVGCVVHCASPGSSDGISSGMVWTLTLVQTAAVGIVARAARRSVRSLDHRAFSTSVAQVKALRWPLAVVAGIAVWFYYIFVTHSLVPSDAGEYYVGGSVYGDMPFHLNIINSFLFGINKHANVFKGFKAVFFADGALVYPFLPDWHIAVLVGCGRFVACVRAPRHQLPQTQSPVLRRHRDMLRQGLRSDCVAIGASAASDRCLDCIGWAALCTPHSSRRAGCSLRVSWCCCSAGTFA